MNLKKQNPRRISNAPGGVLLGTVLDNAESRVERGGSVRVRRDTRVGAFVCAPREARVGGGESALLKRGREAWERREGRGRQSEDTMRIITASKRRMTDWESREPAGWDSAGAAASPQIVLLPPRDTSHPHHSHPYPLPPHHPPTQIILFPFLSHRYLSVDSLTHTLPHHLDSHLLSRSHLLASAPLSALSHFREPRPQSYLGSAPYAPTPTLRHPLCAALVLSLPRSPQAPLLLPPSLPFPLYYRRKCCKSEELALCFFHLHRPPLFSRE